ncbi:MAG: hypothetical protein AAGI53_17150 [Planctomycetota bacterium]
MQRLTEEQTEALLEADTRHLTSPNGEQAEVTATWHHWLAYDELQTCYGWSETELLELLLLEQHLTGRDLSACFCSVVAYAYADCRHQLAESFGAPTWLPLLLSGYDRAA